MRRAIVTAVLLVLTAFLPACEEVDADRDGVTADQDCDDHDDARSPDMLEVCDFIDNDCNGLVDDGLETLAQWPDVDNDGFGKKGAEPYFFCGHIGDSAFNDQDCDDTQYQVNPDARELENDIDDDCNELVDDLEPADEDEE